MRVYGNWCGPGWTAGQYKDAKDLTDEDREVPPIDELDAHCKTHDILLHDYPDKADEINAEFVKQVSQLGITGKLFALAVSVAGPSPVTNLHNTANMKTKRLLNEELYRKREEANQEDFERQYMSTEDNDITLKRKRGDTQDSLGSDGHMGKWQMYDTPMMKETEESKISPDDKPKAARQLNWDWESLSNLNSTKNMETNNPEFQSRSASIGTQTMGNNSGSTETAITKATPTWMEPKTLTKNCAFLQCFSVSRPGNENPLECRILMTQPFNMLSFDPALSAAPTAGAATTQGFFRQMIVDGANLVWSNPVIEYPLNGGYNLDITKVICQGYNAYAQRYDFYTVINCHYKIQMQNTVIGTSGNNHDINCFYGFNTYATANRTGVYPRTNVKLLDEHFFPGLKKVILPCRASGCDANSQGWVTIEGDYKPGQAKRSVLNDGDVKRWTAKNTPPLYSEEMVLRFYSGDMNQASASVVANGVRVRLELVYTIQFKDPIFPIEYPMQVPPGNAVITFPDAIRQSVS